MIVDINIPRNTWKTIPSVQVFMHESTLTLPVFRGVKQLISIFYNDKFMLDMLLRLDKSSISMLSKWTYHDIWHLKFRGLCATALRNLFSWMKSNGHTIDNILHIHIYLFNVGVRICNLHFWQVYVSHYLLSFIICSDVLVYVFSSFYGV